MPMFKEDKAEKADRGKSAEKAVRAALAAYSAKHAEFDWERLVDSRSSRGRVSAQVADFAFFFPCGHGAIEVKTIAHDFRIARSKVPQLPKLRKRTLAGGHCFLLVYHSTNKAWRAVRVQNLAPDVPSWDLSGFAPYTSADAAVEAALGSLLSKCEVTPEIDPTACTTYKPNT
jgi:hypothetical protein